VRSSILLPYLRRPEALLAWVKAVTVQSFLGERKRAPRGLISSDKLGGGEKDQRRCRQLFELLASCVGIDKAPLDMRNQSAL